MTYAALILADSVSPAGARLTTMEITFPRIVLAEFNTHRMFSRNSASSRAIPVEKRIAAVRENPFVPERFAENKKGMQAGGDLNSEYNDWAEHAWLKARDAAVEQAAKLAEIGVHKQWANRLLEPFSWQTCIVTATEWENFFGLRCNPEAQPEIRRVAELMRDAMAASEPKRVGLFDWHLPLITAEDRDDWRTFKELSTTEHPQGTIDAMAKVAIARCARVSYLTHDGKRDPSEDMKLFLRLERSGHLSPFEHVATPCNPAFGTEWSANFYGWVQYRKRIPGEAVFKKPGA